MGYMCKVKSIAATLALILLTVLVLGSFVLYPLQTASAITITKNDFDKPAALDSRFGTTVQLPVTLYDYGMQVGDTWATKNPTVLNQDIAAADLEETAAKDLPSTFRFWDIRHPSWQYPSDATSTLNDKGHIVGGGYWRWGMFNRHFADWSSVTAVPSRDLFGKSDQSCSYNGRKFKQVYDNVMMDFGYDANTNTYHYSSNESSAKFDAGSNRLTKTEDVYDIPSDSIGFWPFGAHETHFGMSMDFDFFLPSKEYLTKNDYYFAFSGDDDLVVYIDDKLALDLGGTHSPVAGYIDFAHEVVVYGKSPIAYHTESFEKFVASSNIPFHKTSLHETGSSWNMETLGYVKFLDLGLNLANSSIHNFKMAYLERAGDASNLMIEMDLAVLAKVNYEVVGDVLPNPDITDPVPIENDELYLYDPYDAKPHLFTAHDGYTFSGWHADTGCSSLWQPGTKLMSTTSTLYGRWEYGEAIKTSDPPAHTPMLPHQQISYVVSYTNQKDRPEKVQISDTVPEGTSYVADSVKCGSGVYSLSGIDNMGKGTLAATWNNVLPGDTVSLEFKVSIDATTIAKTLSNAGIAIVDDGKATYQTDIIEHPVDAPKLSIAKSSNPPTGTAVEDAQVVTYTVDVTNTTAGNMADVIIQDPISEYLMLNEASVWYGIGDSASGNEQTRPPKDETMVSEYKDGVLNVSVPMLNSGQTVRLIYEATVKNMPSVGRREIENTAYTWAPALAPDKNKIRPDNDKAQTGSIVSNTVVHNQSKIEDPPGDFPSTGDSLIGQIMFLLAALGLVGMGIIALVVSFRKSLK